MMHARVRQVQAACGRLDEEIAMRTGTKIVATLSAAAACAAIAAGGAAPRLSAQASPAAAPPAAASPAAPPAQPWWRTAAPGARPYRVDADKLPLISVKGNRFVGPDGVPILFRGIDISDPDKLAGQGHWNRDLFVAVKDLGATLVRIPVHPIAWRTRTPDAYIALLDQAVAWSTELGMHVIIDWHTIGNLQTGLFQDPMYDTSRQETYSFWRTMARHYAGHHTVAFFELFNEPTTYNGQLGSISWAQWSTIVREEIGIIRAYDPQVVPLVAGFDWAYDLTPLKLDPIPVDGIGYTIHPYSNKRSKPWEPKWEEDFGFAAAKYPLMATEFGGFAAPTVAGAPAPTPAPAAPVGRGRGGFGPDPEYGPSIIKYLESHNISWTLWCFDPEWGPSLLSNWTNFQLNASGQFAKLALAGGVK
jgi:hypothetical protein